MIATSRFTCFPITFPFQTDHQCCRLSHSSCSCIYSCKAQLTKGERVLYITMNHTSAYMHLNIRRVLFVALSRWLIPSLSLSLFLSLSLSPALSRSLSLLPGKGWRPGTNPIRCSEFCMIESLPVPIATQVPKRFHHMSRRTLLWAAVPQPRAGSAATWSAQPATDQWSICRRVRGSRLENSHFSCGSCWKMFSFSKNFVAA